MLPLITFVHVPKTAGATIRSVLQDTSIHGHTLYDGEIEHPDFLARAAECDWIAGHIPAELYRRTLQSSDRPVEYFSAVREPSRQVLSHIQESFTRCRNTPLHERTDREKDFDADVTGTDFRDPSRIIDLLERRSDRLLNVQCRYILGDDFAELSDDVMSRRLDAYAFIAAPDTLPRLYAAFGFAALPDDASRRRENRTSVRVDAAGFNAPAVRAFLARRNALDQRLFARVQRMRFKAEERAPFRPSFLRRSLRATRQSFDEDAYLAVNPDVLAAVRSGTFPNGRAHFDVVGYSEPRYVLHRVDPTARRG
jgi:hypothetical protein